LASKSIEFGEKMQSKAIMAFKVIQGHRGRRQFSSLDCICIALKTGFDVLTAISQQVRYL